MKNKYIINSLIAAAMLSVVGCKNDYDPMDTLCDVSWYTSETIKQSGVYKVNVDSFISFMDLSQGCLKHEWIIEEGSKFLKNDFNYKDGNLSSQVDENKGLVSTRQQESVFFAKPGMTKVVLRNVFSEWVRSNTSEPVEAVKEGDDWVLTKEFPIDVYGKLDPAVTVKKLDGTVVLDIEPGYEVSDDKEQWTKIELMAGDQLVFIDKEGGDRPDSRTWAVANRTYSDKEAVVRFTNANTFSGFTISSSRKEPKANVRKIIPLVVTVKPCTDPFEIDYASSYVDVTAPDIIVLQAKNGAFLKATGVTDDFTVKVASDNTELDVIEVVIDESDNSRLNLKLATPVYPDEKILVSYNVGANEIVATNANRVLQNFSDQEIRNDYLGESVIPDAALKLCGFELPYAGNYWADNNSLKHCSLSGDRYYEGAQSLKVDINSVLSSQIFFMQSEPKYFALEPGTYKLMHYIYVEKAGSGLAGKPYSAYSMGANNEQHDEDGQIVQFKFPEKTGEWVLNSLVVTYTADDIKNGKMGYKFVFPQTTPQGSLFYIDNINLIKLR